MNNNETLGPRIYVACIAAYNAGHLHGCWISANQGIDIIYQHIYKMLSEGPVPNAEEWAVHGYEGLGGLEIDEYESIQSVCEKAEFYEVHGELGIEALAHYGDIGEAKRALENHYHGAFDSELDFAAGLFDEVYAHNLPGHIQPYIDYGAFCRDVFINDYLSFTVGGRVHVFSRY